MAALICSAVWGLGAGIPTLAETDLPRIVSLFMAAVRGTIRNKAIRPRLDSLRWQCQVRKVV